MYDAAEVVTSVFGYIPNSPANITLVSCFALIMFAQVPLGIYHREWWMCVTWGITAALEMICYDARFVGHREPGWRSMYEMQMICNVVAPSFMAAGLYKQLSKQVEIFGHQYSPLKPRFFSRVFITADVVGFFIQSTGGGLAATGGSSSDLGRWLMVAGVAFQAVFLLAFAAIFVVVNVRIFQDQPHYWSQKYEENRRRPLFKFWIPAVAASLLFLLVRSIYRVIELANGWNGYLARTEWYFLALDGLMILLGMIPLTVIYPAMAYGKVDVSKDSDLEHEIDVFLKEFRRIDTDEMALIDNAVIPRRENIRTRA